MSQNLKGILPDKAVTVIQQLSVSLSTLSTRFNALASKPLLTAPEAEAKYGPGTMVKALQVSGSDPLNITGLIGQLSQNQLAQIPNFSSIPTSGKYSQPGTLITVNGVLTVVTAPGRGATAGADAKTVNGAAVPVSSTLVGTNSLAQIIAAALAAGKIWIGSAGSLPVAQTPSGAWTISSAGVSVLTKFAYIPGENGANNAIACAAGTGPPLIDGLQVTVKLAHSLHAGANTFDYLTSGTPWNIVSHFNPANNLVTAYVSGAYITLVADLAATLWLDMSQ